MSRIIKLPKGQVALVSNCDYKNLINIRWGIYPVKNGQGKKYNQYVAYYSKVINKIKTNFYMHNIIMNPPIGYEIDHIDGNTLNNQRSNLRIVTHQQNCFNRKPRSDKKYPKYKGVGLHKGRFRARIHNNQKEEHIGYYKTEIEAALAYDKRAKQVFGEFAKLNFYE